MAAIGKPNTFSAGATILAAEHNENFDTIYNDYNGNITNVNIAANAAIADTKLAQITTASKVVFSALTVASQAQGDIMYYNGSAWTRLGTGTDGKVLTAGGAGTNPAWEATEDWFVTATTNVYDSGWFAANTTTKKYSKTHGLGTTALLITIYYADDDSGTNMQTCTADFTGSGASHGTIVKGITTTALVVQTGSEAICRTVADNGTPADKTSGYLRVVCLALA